MRPLRCWLGFHREIRGGHTRDGCGGEYISAHCVPCGQQFFWWRHDPWAPLGSLRKAATR